MSKVLIFILVVSIPLIVVLKVISTDTTECIARGNEYFNTHVVYNDRRAEEYRNKVCDSNTAYDFNRLNLKSK